MLFLDSPSYLPPLSYRYPPKCSSKRSHPKFQLVPSSSLFFLPSPPPSPNILESNEIQEGAQETIFGQSTRPAGQERRKQPVVGYTLRLSLPSKTNSAKYLSGAASITKGHYEDKTCQESHPGSSFYCLAQLSHNTRWMDVNRKMLIKGRSPLTEVDGARQEHCIFCQSRNLSCTEHRIASAFPHSDPYSDCHSIAENLLFSRPSSSSLRRTRGSRHLREMVASLEKHEDHLDGIEKSSVAIAGAQVKSSERSLPNNALAHSKLNTPNPHSPTMIRKAVRSIS